MCVYMCVCVLRARGAEFGGFAGGGLEGVLGVRGFINAAGKWMAEFFKKKNSLQK
jgi:hypothetical protein